MNSPADTSDHVPGRDGAETPDADPRAAEVAALAPLLAAHIGSARWFRGSGDTVEVQQVASLPWLTPPGVEPAVRIEIVTVGRDRTGAGSDPVTEAYQVPVCYRREPLEGAWGSVPVPGLGDVHAHDGSTDPDALRVLWHLFRGGRLHLGDESSLQAIQVEDDDIDQVGAGDLDPAPLTGEQSNTSIRYGDLALLKLFRRIEPGRNLELERLLGMHQKAPVDPESDPAPRLLGWFEADWVDGDHQVWADLGVLTEQIRPAFDGWVQGVEHCTDGNDFGPGCEAIGIALARLHARLAKLAEPQRRPHPDVLAEITARVEQNLTDVDALAELAGPVRAALAELAATDAADVVVQQVHGDFHLGQVLFAPPAPGAPRPRARIIDFEGEPLATPEQRREPASVAKDVAGLMRSLAYARAAAMTGGADPEAARTWQRSAEAALLGAYAGEAGTDLPPALLRAHLIEKAVYEVGYEARHRPDWLPMARLSLAELLDSCPRANAGGNPTTVEEHR